VTLAPPRPEGLLSLATSTSTTITPNGQHINLELRYLLPSFKLFLPHPSSALTFILSWQHTFTHSTLALGILEHFFNTFDLLQYYTITSCEALPYFDLRISSGYITISSNFSHHHVGIHQDFTGRSCRLHFPSSASYYSLEAFKVCFYPLFVVH